MKYLPIHLQWRIFRDHSGPDGSFSSSISSYSLPISLLLIPYLNSLYSLISLFFSFSFELPFLSISSSGSAFPPPLLIFTLTMAVAVSMASLSSGLHSNSSSLPLKSSETRFGSWVLAKNSIAFQTKCFCLLQRGRWSSSNTKTIPRASSATAVEDGSNDGTDTIPTPIVIIDQDSDQDATVVEITFGDRLGALLDTMNALKNLGLNVIKANVFLDSSGKHNKFSITKADTGRKVDDPELLEAIRLTVINNLIQYHPESSAQLAMGAAFGVVPPQQQVDVDIATHISIQDDGPNRSLLYVEAADRPGLLVDLVKIITDINVAVDSGEFDTEGLLAKAKFHVSYRDKALIKPLQQVISNSLRYFLRRPTTEDASF